MGIPKNFFAKRFGKLKMHKNGDGYSINLDFTFLGEKLDIAQDALDAQVLQDMIQYMPIDSGTLIDETVNYNMNTRGEVYAYPPDLEYGHYQYEGEKYVDPDYGVGAFYNPNYGFWSRKGVKKVPSGEPLFYTNPQAEAHWDETAFAYHHTEWENLVKRML